MNSFGFDMSKLKKVAKTVKKDTIVQPLNPSSIESCISTEDTEAIDAVRGRLDSTSRLLMNMVRGGFELPKSGFKDIMSTIVVEAEIIELAAPHVLGKKGKKEAKKLANISGILEDFKMKSDFDNLTAAELSTLEKVHTDLVKASAKLKQMKEDSIIQCLTGK